MEVVWWTLVFTFSSPQVLVTRRRSKSTYENERRNRLYVTTKDETSSNSRHLSEAENTRLLNVLMFLVLAYLCTLVVSLVFLFLNNNEQPKWFWYAHLYVDSIRLSVTIVGPLMATALLWWTPRDMYLRNTDHGTCLNTRGSI